MISLENVTVRLGGVQALSELTVDLVASVHGVIGPNGAGKTTLLNVLSGFVRPSSGSITADGTVLDHYPGRRRALWGLRRTFQTEYLAPALSARANVAVMTDTTFPRGGRAAEVERALAFARVSEPEVSAGALDGFQRRLVEIARALAGRPRIVLLDEPASGLSTEEGEILADVIRGIPDEYGAQVVLVDHDVELIASTCDQSAVLDFGKLLASGPTREVLDDEHVKRAWLGTAEVEWTAEVV